jgi:hypothetical protein
MSCIWSVSKRLLAIAAVAAGIVPVNGQPSPDLSGIWVLNGDTRLPGEPAYQPWAKKLYDERKAGGTQDDPEKYCLPNGVVRVTSLPYKIVQTPALVVVLSEGNTHSYRRFFLDGRSHPQDEDPSWTGHSTGKWEGDTLLVDTVNFNDRTWLDSTGKPHSEALHVIERYRRRDAEHLEVQYVLEDPKALLKPYQFTRTFTLARNREIQEYFCTDRNIAADK